MKKRITILTMLSTIILTSGIAAGQTVYPLDIPDVTFRTYLFNSFDKNGDAVLSDGECDEVTEIVVDDFGDIKSVEGIEYFSHLKRLMCDGNVLEQINVTQNRELEVLTFNDNYVSHIDLSGNPVLAELYCADNVLMELDITQNSKLGFLDCRGNLLKTLNISCNSELEMLKTDLTGSAIVKNKVPVQATAESFQTRFDESDSPYLYDWEQIYNQDMEGVCFGISWDSFPGADGYEVRTAYYYGDRWSDWVYEEVQGTYYEVGYSAGSGIKSAVRAYKNTSSGKVYSDWSWEQEAYATNDEWTGPSPESGTGQSGENSVSGMVLVGSGTFTEQMAEETVVDHVRNNYPECGFTDISASAWNLQGSMESGYYRASVTATASNDEIKMNVDYLCSFYENKGDWYLDTIGVEDGNHQILKFTLTEEDARYFTGDEFVGGRTLRDIVLSDHKTDPDGHTDTFIFKAKLVTTRAGFDEYLRPVEKEYEEDATITVEFLYKLYSGWEYGSTDVRSENMIDLGGGAKGRITLAPYLVYR